MLNMRLNPGVSYREKNAVFVFYYDFNYWFFSGEAGKLVGLLLKKISTGEELDDLPKSFLDYCKSKQILEEVTA